MISDYYRPASSRHKLATGELPGALVGAIIGGLAGAGTGAAGMYARNKDLELEQAAGVVSKKKKHSVGISAAIGGVTGAVLGGLAGAAITHVPEYHGHKPREPKKSVDPFFGPGAKKMNKAKTPDRHSFTDNNKVEPEKYLKQYYKDAPGGWNQVKTTSIEAASETPGHRHVSDLSHIPKTYLGTVDARKADNLNDAEGMCAEAEIPMFTNPDHPLNTVNIKGHLPSGSQDFDYRIHGGWPLNGINNRINGLDGHRPISAEEAGTLILGHEARHAATMLDRQTLPPEATPPRYVYPSRQAELTQALGSLKAETAQMSGGRVIHNSDDFRRLMNDSGVTSPDKKILDGVKEQYSPEGARMLHYMRSIWMKDPEKYEELLDAWDTEKLYDQVVKGQGPPGLKIATAKNFFKNKRAEGLLQLPEPKKPGKLSVLVTKPDALSKKIAELVTPELPEEKPRSLSAQVLNPKPEALSKKIASELLKGGPGDNKPDSDFNPRDLAKGIKEEQAEHGGQVRVIKELVKDHLTEHPKEYSKRAAHPALGPLLLAKEKSDKGDYGGKYHILRTLISDAPQDWKVDSESEGIYGLTHNPTGFKMHAPRQILPQGTGIEERWRASKPSNTDVSAALQSKVAAWDRATDIRKEIVGDQKYPFSYLTGEAKELAEALLSRKWPDIKEEASDTAYAAQILFDQATGLNLPMVGTRTAVDKFRARMAPWKTEFEEKGIPFSTNYLRGGSNHARPHKVRGAFSLAGHELPEGEEYEISARMGRSDSSVNPTSGSMLKKKMRVLTD